MKPLALCMLLAAFVASPVLAADTSAATRGVAFFEQKIRPVLVKHCYQCHSRKSKSVKGKLLLDTREGIRKGGETGPAVVPKNAKKSLLLEALRHESLEMPPNKKLPARVIADFETWIKMGAPDPRYLGDPGDLKESKIDFTQARKFWSFQPPRRHAAPPVADRAWVRKPIDAFVLSRLEKAGLQPNPQTDRRTLIRRLSFDLIGLPPTPAEVEAFVRDRSPKAIERLVDRLLSSRHYGERWARMWLDVARYAEDQAHIVGNNRSLFYPNAYLYRDWVIAAFNNDMPYDRFVTLQLAADFVEPKSGTNEAALGFIGLGPKYYRRNAPEVMAEEWENQVDTVARGLLGLTVACARCHDHKYDPIPTEDYYALAGVFAGTQMYNKPLPNRKTGPRKATKKKGKKKRRRKNSPANSIHVVRDNRPRDIHVQIRGNYKTKGPLVKRRFLQVLSPLGPKYFTKGSGRLELAHAIADRNNPLTARVIVNRVWMMHFGKPIVGTPSNFGKLGERPTHPELLDDLAVRFMENRWSLKWLHREIVLSSTWQQSSDIVAAKHRADPANRLLGRMNRRRLDVESWRDAILSVTGRLDLTIGGKSIDPRKPDARRRTVYARISRLKLNSMLAMFDHPDPNAHSARRVETTTTLQKLFVLNSPFMVTHSEALAKRCLAAAKTDAARIRWAYATVFGRPVTKDELSLGLQFLRKPDTGHPARWEQYAQVLLASNELLMID
ncbi:MAG: PSD1 and planctomycete cytochrome C domain-containing protein [Planctomycetaceae bacterium]